MPTARFPSDYLLLFQLSYCLDRGFLVVFPSQELAARPGELITQLAVYYQGALRSGFVLGLTVRHLTRSLTPLELSIVWIVGFSYRLLCLFHRLPARECWVRG